RPLTALTTYQRMDLPLLDVCEAPVEGEIGEQDDAGDDRDGDGHHQGAADELVHLRPLDARHLLLDFDEEGDCALVRTSGDEAGEQRHQGEEAVEAAEDVLPARGSPLEG